MVFKVFQKLFTTLYNTYINFLFASLKSLTDFENAYWNPTQNSLWLVDVLWCPPLIGCMENAQICFMVFEAGYWKDFLI
jgi:hypothetical protein